jgi:hypothetical protein
MIGDLTLKVEFFAALMQADESLAVAVAAKGCPHCGGPLHVANYERKPRGGAFAEVGEGFRLRHSLCCGRRGCRRRVLPPSLRFLGRKVYLEIVVILAAAWLVEAAEAMRAAARHVRVSARTLARWRRWWGAEVPLSKWWAELRSRLAPPTPDETDLPRSLLEHLGRLADGGDLVKLVAKCLAPATTPLAEAAGFVREAAFALAAG